jgi:hypothetical protein
VLVLLGLCLHAAVAAAERGVLSPSAAHPAELAPGGLLTLEVEVATGLTPPPGIQDERAHRAFAITLCAEGLDLGGGTRRCFPLAVTNVRPFDAASLRYRVVARLPIWLAPSTYDLSLRFPGGQAELVGALQVRGAQREQLSGAARVTRRGAAIELEAGAAPGLVRVHVAGAGMALSGGSFEAFPLPDPAAGFAPGFVALVRLEPAAHAIVTKRQENVASALRFEPKAVEAGRPVVLRAAAAPAGSRLFWWLGATRAGLGSALPTRFLYPGTQRVQLLSVARDGRAALAERALPIWQHRAHGCAMGPLPERVDDLGCCVGLLVLSRSWKLRPRFRRRRRGAC